MRPFIIATSSMEMASPRPVPPKRRDMELSAWLKASKMISRRSTGIPGPVSRTEKCNMTDAVPLVWFDVRRVVGSLHNQVDFTGICKFYGIADQIDDDLPKPMGISYQGIRHVR